VFLTPHIAGAVGSERTRLGDLVADEVERFVSGRPLQHQVQPSLLRQLA
jgi:phosphoglycerate dehydrogenase-like enzyme